MSEHKAIVSWNGTGIGFIEGEFSREHLWTFDGGVTVPASASPFVVPTPYSNPKAVDPEEAYVAAIASCHMLTFLYLASKHGFQVSSYHDEAVGTMTENENAVKWINSVTLHPQIKYGFANVPTPTEEEQLHHMAHQQCFIANSVKTIVVVKHFLK